MQTSRKGRILSLLGIVTFFLALLPLFTRLVLPALSTLLISVQNYQPSRGIAGSPFVGLRIYEDLFQSPSFAVSVQQSAQFAALSALTVLAVGAPAGYVLRALSKARWLRHGLCTLLLLPLLVPGELWAQAFLAVLPSQAMESLAVLAFWSGIKYVGLAAWLTTAALGRGNRSATAPVMSAGAVALGILALLGLPDYAFLQMSPLTAMEGSLDLVTFRRGFGAVSQDYGAAQSIVALALRAALLAAVALPVATLVKRLFPHQGAQEAPTTGKERLYSLLAVAAVTLIVAIALAVPAAGAPYASFLPNLAIYPLYVLTAVAAAALNTALCFFLARPVVTARHPAVRWVTAILLLVLTALGATPVLVGGYMQMRLSGVFNTFYAVLASGIGSLMGVWPLVFAARAMGVGSNRQWFRRMWQPALVLLALTAALRMNDALPSILYLLERDRLHPLLVVSSLQGGTAPLAAISALIALVTMVVPVVLLLAVRTAFAEQETPELGLLPK